MGPRQPQVYGPMIQMETALVADQFCCSILEKTLTLGNNESRRRRRRQRVRRLDGVNNSMDMTLSKLRETVKDREAWHAAVHGVTQQYSDFARLAFACLLFLAVY